MSDKFKVIETTFDSEFPNPVSGLEDLLNNAYENGHGYRPTMIVRVRESIAGKIGEYVDVIILERVESGGNPEGHISGSELDVESGVQDTGPGGGVHEKKTDDPTEGKMEG